MANGGDPDLLRGANSFSLRVDSHGERREKIESNGLLPLKQTLNK